MAGINPFVLLNLARDNKVEELRAAVGAGIPVDIGNQMGQTAIHIAALWGNVEALHELLKLGADPNIENFRGARPLHFAACAKKNAAAACKVLMDGGADPKEPDVEGMLPYMRAESDDICQLLGGPNPNLFIFASKGMARELQQLLAGGCEVIATNAEGHHALNLAIESGSMETVQVLLKHNPKMATLPDMTGATPLHAAAAAANHGVLKLLLTMGVDLDARDLHMSNYSGGDWLGANSELIEPFDRTALHCAVEGGDVEAAQLLLQAGANANILDFDGRSPLHGAIENSDAAMAEALLQQGANANQPNKDFISAIHHCSQRGPLSMLQLLLRHGGDANLASAVGGWRPLHLAARAGAAEKVQALLAAGAQAGVANEQGNTPLHLAAANGRIKVMQQLLQAEGVEPMAKNADNQTPLDMAKTDEVENCSAQSEKQACAGCRRWCPARATASRQPQTHRTKRHRTSRAQSGGAGPHVEVREAGKRGPAGFDTARGTNREVGEFLTGLEKESGRHWSDATGHTKM